VLGHRAAKPVQRSMPPVAAALGESTCRNAGQTRPCSWAVHWRARGLSAGHGSRAFVVGDLEFAVRGHGFRSSRTLSAGRRGVFLRYRRAGSTKGILIDFRARTSITISRRMGEPPPSAAFVSRFRCRFVGGPHNHQPTARFGSLPVQGHCRHGRSKVSIAKCPRSARRCGPSHPPAGSRAQSEITGVDASTFRRGDLVSTAAAHARRSESGL